MKCMNKQKLTHTDGTELVMQACIMHEWIRNWLKNYHKCEPHNTFILVLSVYNLE